MNALRESQPGGIEGLIGQSEPLRRMVDMAHRAAPTDLTVLIHQVLTPDEAPSA